MCSLAVPDAYSTFSKRTTYLNYMRIWSTSEVTFFPSTTEHCWLTSATALWWAGWRAGSRSRGPWGNEWHSQWDFEQPWGCICRATISKSCTWEMQDITAVASLSSKEQNNLKNRSCWNHRKYKSNEAETKTPGYHKAEHQLEWQQCCLICHAIAKKLRGH